MRILSTGFAVAAVLVAATAAQASTTVVLTSGYTSTGKSFVYTDGDIDFSVTALTYSGAPFSAAQTPAVSTPKDYDQGLGVNPSGDNRHTVDNSQAWDFLLFRFDTAVALTGATFSNANWYRDNFADTDASISFATVDLAAIGMGQTISTSLVNGARTDFFNSGVKLPFGANMFSSDTNIAGNSSRIFNASLGTGNVWLVGASVTSTGFIDSFKLKSITFQAPPPVPEPSVWITMILGFGVLGGAMRRRNREALAAA